MKLLSRSLPKFAGIISLELQPNLAPNFILTEGYGMRDDMALYNMS
jgi:hypothetical protein